MFGKNGTRPIIARVWLSTAEEIATAIGRNRHDIPRLVQSENLPAFKFYGKWTALSEDVATWSKSMAAKYRSMPKRKRKRGGPSPVAGME
jgi:hypothetical protein